MEMKLLLGQTYELVNLSTGAIVASRITSAENVIDSTRGLLGRQTLSPGEGLFLKNTASIHTFFMRMPLDLISIDKEGKVVKTKCGLAPFRLFLGGKGAHSIVELPEGSLKSVAVNIGDVLVLR